MAVIGQQAFVLAPTSDKYLSLANEEYVRKLDLTGFGNNWQKIRIALNCSFANTGGGALSISSLFVGLCSGTALPYGSQQCVHAVGYLWGDPQGSQSATYAAGGGNPYYSGGMTIYGIRKVGAGYTSASIGSTTYAFVATGGTLERRGWLCADIQQTATQAIINGKTEAVASAASDVFYEHSQYCTNQGGNPDVLETAAAQLTQTLTPGAGWNNNALDSVNIFWRSSTYDLRIYSISVCFTP